MLRLLFLPDAEVGVAARSILNNPPTEAEFRRRLDLVDGGRLPTVGSANEYNCDIAILFDFLSFTALKALSRLKLAIATHLGLLYISLGNYDKNHFLTNAEVVAAGKTIYEQQIRQLVETPENIGKMLTLNIVNQLLQNYSIQVDYPDVSGAEHLETLQIRDRLAEAESDFTDEERAVLVEADRKLMMNTTKIYQELSQFIDLSRYRIEQGISAQRWWWYLDVLNYLPSVFDRVIQSSITQRNLKSA